MSEAATIALWRREEKSYPARVAKGSSRLSSGILMFRSREQIEVLLIKPGGPFWRNKDQGAWMIPKGAVEEGEVPAEAAAEALAA